MATAITPATDTANIMERVLIVGDLAQLTPQERVNYYMAVCKSVGLNPMTKPLSYITLNGKLTLYANKDAADQLRSINDVSIDDVDISETTDNFVVKVKGHDKSGRADVEIGIVKKSDMQGNTANAQMKAVTKAKRRLTLSICGLGLLDETEVETIPDARPVTVIDSGEIVTGETIDPEQSAKSLSGVKTKLTPRPAEDGTDDKQYRYNDAKIVAVIAETWECETSVAAATLHAMHKSGDLPDTMTIDEAVLVRRPEQAPLIPE